MKKLLHEDLISSISALRRLLANHTTESVLKMVAAQLIQWPSKNIGLKSPQRQLSYLLGLLMTTPEPPMPREMDQEWDDVIGLLEKIFSSYAVMFSPSGGQLGQLTQAGRDARKVAMPAFLHYYYSGLMASTEQVRDWIRRYIVPHDAVIKDILGLSAMDMLRIASMIGELTQADYDRLSSLSLKEKDARLSLLNEAERQGWDDEMIERQVSEDSRYGEIAHDYLTAIDKVFTVEREPLQSEFGTNQVNAFLHVFSAKRGSVEDFTYPTQWNPATEKPLYELDNGTLISPSVHWVNLAILERAERAMRESAERDKFFRQRDKGLEDHVAEILTRFFGKSASVLQSVFETNRQQFEHDVVVRWEDKLLVIEAKAATSRAPLRDPDRAFVRIRDDFRGNRGIQAAYNQARRIEIMLKDKGAIQLYNKHGKPVCEAPPGEIDRIYSICVTRDNYGLLATDLSLLLEKEAPARYPLAINILDLDSLLDAFSYIKWGPEKLCEYMEGREEMHGRVSASDELDYAGFLISHGTFEKLLEKGRGGVFIYPDYSGVFDEIFYAKRGGETVSFDPTPPVFTNLSSGDIRVVTKAMPHENHQRFRGPSARKQGRNEPCSCGSGRKYKRCCGK